MPSDDLLASRRGTAVVIVAISLLALAPRLALIHARDFFFDEVFTSWIARQSFAGIVHALALDSGPPLYYFVVHAIGHPSLLVVRYVSLLFACGSIAAILFSRRLGTSRFLAAALFAVYPPAIFAAADARAYALCALCVTIAILALDAHRDWTAAFALVLAAWAHYYGLFFFPILLLRVSPHPAFGHPLPAAAGRGSTVSFAPRERGEGGAQRRMRGVLPFVVACVLFLPWLPIALHQPPEATKWITERVTWQPFANLSFAGRYPESLFAPATWSVVAIALFLLAVAGSRVNRFAAITAIPVACVFLLNAFGRSAYFPVRFESVLAPPLVLWLATSLESMRRGLRFATAGLLMTIGIITATNGIVDHARRPLDDYNAAAVWVAQHAAPAEPVVATGYLFLETLQYRSVIAFPAEQAQHPGWRASHAAGSAIPSDAFLWVGERGAPELAAIARRRRVEPLYVNARAMVARVR